MQHLLSHTQHIQVSTCSKNPVQMSMTRHYIIQHHQAEAHQQVPPLHKSKLKMGYQTCRSRNEQSLTLQKGLSTPPRYKIHWMPCYCNRYLIPRLSMPQMVPPLPAYQTVQHSNSPQRPNCLQSQMPRHTQILQQMTTRHHW